MVFVKQVYMQEYNQKYYMVHKQRLDERKQQRRYEGYFTLNGHLEPIHDAIRRYASQWKIPIDSLKKFRRWAIMDATYEQLFKAWEEAHFSKELTPVVMRRVKKNGFVIDNLYWSTKKQHSWWSGEVDKLNVLRKEMEKRQIKNNEADEDEQQEMLGRLKAKRKK
jgi:hypothetical protein